MTNHLVAPFDLLANEKKYQELPEGHKEILLKAGKEAGDHYTKLVVDMFEKDKGKMEKAGVKFIDIDTAPFAREAMKVAERFEAGGMWKKGLFKQILESQ